nr:hypothetical protein [Spongiactinospora gelatinilytica]
MKTDLNTLLTALYARIDDWLGRPPRIGRPPKLTDAELLTLAVVRHCSASIPRPGGYATFPRTYLYLPGQSGYNKRLHKAPATAQSRDPGPGHRHRPVAHDPVWLADSTPVECGRSRPTARRSALAGRAGYG